MVPKALTVAGFDPSGGAGILADVRTFNRYGVYGAAVITALTSQDTRSVYAVHPLPAGRVKRDLEILLSDMDFGAVKLGMLATGEIAEAVSHILAGYGVRNLVIDPVIRATSGAVLLNGEGVRVMVEKLLPLATIVTPNVPEAEILAGMEIRSPGDVEEAARRILDLGPEAVLVKGGHLKGEPMDFLRVRRPDGDRAYRFIGERIEGDVHGTGCVLASSIAALLSLGCDLITAVSLAVSDVKEALKEGTIKVGKGRAVIFAGHGEDVPCRREASPTPL